MKVIDKRMFTADGELRQEYRESEAGSEASADSGSAGQPVEAPAPAAAPAPSAESAPATESAAAETGPVSGSAAAPADEGTTGTDTAGQQAPEGAEALPAPGFLDLVDMLVQPILIYLGDLQLPDGKSAEDLPLARRHIDLLDVLMNKTQGNLSDQEQAIVSDLLYRLRLRYVQKTT